MHTCVPIKIYVRNRIYYDGNFFCQWMLRDWTKKDEWTITYYHAECSHISTLHKQKWACDSQIVSRNPFTFSFSCPPFIINEFVHMHIHKFIKSWGSIKVLWSWHCTWMRFKSTHKNCFTYSLWALACRTWTGVPRLTCLRNNI